MKKLDYFRRKSELCCDIEKSVIDGALSVIGASDSLLTIRETIFCVLPKLSRKQQQTFTGLVPTGAFLHKSVKRLTIPRILLFEGQ